MNQVSHLRNTNAQVKLKSIDKAMLCVIENTEESGLWITGTTVLEAVVKIGGATALRDPVVFVPFQNVEWVLAASE